MVGSPSVTNNFRNPQLTILSAVLGGGFLLSLTYSLHRFSDSSTFRYTPGSTNIAGWKMNPLNEDVYFLLKMEIFHDIPFLYVSLRVITWNFWMRKPSSPPGPPASKTPRQTPPGRRRIARFPRRRRRRRWRRGGRGAPYSWYKVGPYQLSWESKGAPQYYTPKN